MPLDVVRLVSFHFTAETERSPQWQPATDVYRTPEGCLVKFELAGVFPQDIELSINGRTLRVRGRRRDWCLEPGCRLVHMEISYSRFERQVELPADLGLVRITSEFRHGMLLVRIQREGHA